ncbi:MAG: 4-hydroxy-3-methylbut-2-enyl diphosphate reductase [Thermodesulfovibrionales bacterium]
MEVLVAKRAGFCFGVKRAVDIAFSVAKEKKRGVFTFGPIIHNPQVVEKLGAAGVRPVRDLRSLARKDVQAIIVRTHGVPRQHMARLSEKGYEIVDATCPFVKNAQHYAKLLKDEGYRVFILGDREHPEVQGIMSYAGRGAVVVKNREDFHLVRGNKVGVVVQTTQQVESLKELLSVAAERSRELKIFNTICSSTALRLKETEAMAGAVDVMVIVGGKNSANTTQLANRARALSVPTYHIETATEIEQAWFRGAERVGITAGASTPDWLIEEVRQRIIHIGGTA